MRFLGNQNYNFRGVCHVLDKWSKIKCFLIILRYYHVKIFYQFCYYFRDFITVKNATRSFKKSIILTCTEGFEKCRKSKKSMKMKILTL
jgi:hypothetical protein